MLMSDNRSVREICAGYDTIKQLVIAARSDESAKNKLLTNAHDSFEKLIECADAREELIDYLHEENKLLTTIKDSAQRTADSYERANEELMAFYQTLQKELGDLVDVAVFNAVDQVKTRIEQAGVLKEGVQIRTVDQESEEEN